MPRLTLYVSRMEVFLNGETLVLIQVGELEVQFLGALVRSRFLPGLVDPTRSSLCFRGVQAVVLSHNDRCSCPCR